MPKFDLAEYENIHPNICIDGVVYFIPNQQKEILHKRGITTLAKRDISANCIWQKPSTNFWTDSSYAPIGPESNADFFNALKFVKNKMLEIENYYAS